MSRVIRDVDRQGYDATTFARDLLEHLRNLLVAASAAAIARSSICRRTRSPSSRPGDVDVRATRCTGCSSTSARRTRKSPARRTRASCSRRRSRGSPRSAASSRPRSSSNGSRRSRPETDTGRRGQRTEHGWPRQPPTHPCPTENGVLVSCPVHFVHCVLVVHRLHSSPTKVETSTLLGDTAWKRLLDETRRLSPADRR